MRGSDTPSARPSRPAWRLGFTGLVWLVVLLTGAAAAAQEGDYTVALFTPNLDFRDGVARNEFVSAVADGLSADTGKSWRARAFARESDFEAALRKGEVDVAVIDGEYFAAKGGSMTPVAALSARGSTSKPMKLLVKSGYKALHELRGKTLIIPRAGGYSERFVSGDVLGGELGADEFFGTVEYAKDVRAAINAVELGKADATLVFDGYGGGLSALVTTSAVPLPVLAVTSERIDGDLLAAVKKSARSLGASGADLVSGSSGYDPDAVSRYRAKASVRRASLKPLVVDPAPLVLDVGRISEPERRESLDPGQGGEAFLLPALADLELPPGTPRGSATAKPDPTEE